MREIEQQHPYLAGKKIMGPADPAIWDASRGESIAEMAARHGIFFDKGDNARIAGWMQIHYRLQFDDNGIPMMYIFSNCKAFIRTMPLMMFSETNPEDIDTELEDHVADEVRYMCMSRPIKPRAKTVKERIYEDPLNQRVTKEHKVYY
ncbi:MAG: Terminase-like family protein, partial [Lachnospiraceae bacterium]|nr:Terminase-like family protein [Lachnospiraceae bacterium]